MKGGRRRARTSRQMLSLVCFKECRCLQHADRNIVAAKYKEYDHLRRKPAAEKSTPRKRAAKDEREVLKERPANVIDATPKRDTKDKQSVQLLQAPPAIQEEPTPACVRFALGPTPQKDGEVLGIFDCLSTATPSKGSSEAAMISDLAVSATPSKHRTSSEDNKLSRTPQSSGKRFFLGAFVDTPLKRKREDEDCTPSVTTRQFATPSFLRRNVPMTRIDEEDGDGGITAPPFKKRNLVRSLSSIIQGLRRQEEQKMDEEWDILREIEDEESGIARTSDPPKILVEDSQVVKMPLGPDQGPALGEKGGDVDPGGLDAHGNPKKVWKKKGQKRQTKRVKMRPVMHQPKKAVEAGVDVVEETQNPDDSAEWLGDDAEFEDRGGDSDFEEDPNKPGTERKKARKQPNAKAKPKAQDNNKDDNSGKGKKVGVQAHANFRKLKIKNKNSKANRRGKKFGRR
jgi:DNA replication regulator SLD2